MKQTENNEIDLLLRNLAKRGEPRSISGAGNAENQSSVSHLDADELNSFAERALPAATRARYTAHLVDCSRCREIVAQLTAAAGLPVSESEPGRKTGITFWQRLGALLSPPVLRYAVPALALLAVITVGIVSLRQQRPADFVAQNQEGVRSELPAETPSDKFARVEPQPRVTTTSPDDGQSQKTAASKADQTQKSGEKTQDAQGLTTFDSVSNLPAKDAPKPGAAAQPQPSFAPEPAPALPPARPQTAAADAKKNEEEAKQKESAAGAVAKERDETANTVSEGREVTVSSSRKAASAGRGGADKRAMGALRGEAAQSKRADDDGETRSVEGRRFRKQGNTWVDTAYDASRPMTTIVRGSEQYRALVADEPGIRSVAEKLSGEVILIWKGRAYRIR